MVVLYHYSTWYVQSKGYSVTPPLFSFEAGKFGVYLFFIISGFVIFLTLKKTNHVMDFAVSRFARLYPAYWVAVVLIFSMVYVFSLPGREVSLESALFNMTMLQGWVGVRNVDGVFWTLAMELVFYLIVATLYYLRLLDKISAVSLGWLLLIFLSRYISLNYNVEINEYLKLFMLLEYGSLFIMGIMFYKIMEEKCLSAYFVASVALSIDMYVRPESSLFVFFCFVAFLLFVYQKLFFLKLSPLIFLGSISYSLYLVHQNIGYIVIHSLEKFQLANAVTVILIPLFVSILLATLITFYIEKPSLIYIKNKWVESKVRKKIICI